jgi:phage shock protein A
MPGTDANGPTPNDAECEAAGSNVIPFPGRLRPVAEALVPGVEDDAARLDRALLALTQALAKQREAVRTWRQGLGNLAGSMGSLTDGLCALDAELQAASARLKTNRDGRSGSSPGEGA